jgi:hypothetical protein
MRGDAWSFFCAAVDTADTVKRGKLAEAVILSYLLLLLLS